MEVPVYISIVAGTLLIISEILPYIKAIHGDGIAHAMHIKVSKLMNTQQ